MTIPPGGSRFFLSVEGFSGLLFPAGWVRTRGKARAGRLFTRLEGKRCALELAVGFCYQCTLADSREIALDERRKLSWVRCLSTRNAPGQRACGAPFHR